MKNQLAQINAAVIRKHEMPSAAADKIAHTPGPCRVRNSLKHRSTAQHEASWETVISDKLSNRIIAKVTESTLGNEHVGTANARLIAAAPALLEAAKKMMAFYNDLSKSNPGFIGKLVLQDYAQWNEAMIEFPAAIKQAEKGK